MMKDEKKELNLARSFLDFGHDGGEDCDEFIGFFDERFGFLRQGECRFLQAGQASNRFRRVPARRSRIC